MSWDDSRRLTDNAAEARLVAEIRVDRQASTPLYRQVALRLREMIDKGTLRAGTPLPTEPQLARDIHVSRYTLRQAIDELARDGFVRRVHGRGNFIARPAGGSVRTLWASPSMARQGSREPWRVRVVRVDYVASVPEPSCHLAAELEGIVTEVVRIRLDGITVLSMERIYIPGEAIVSIDTDALSAQRVTQLLERWHGVKTTHGREQLRLTQADDETRRLLGLPPSAAIFLRETLFFHDDRVLAIRRRYVPALTLPDDDAVGQQFIPN